MVAKGVGASLSSGGGRGSGGTVRASAEPTIVASAKPIAAANALPTVILSAPLTVSPASVNELVFCASMQPSRVQSSLAFRSYQPHHK